MRTRFDLKLALLFLLKELKPVHLSQNDKTFNFDDLFPLSTTTFSLNFFSSSDILAEKKLIAVRHSTTNVSDMYSVVLNGANKLSNVRRFRIVVCLQKG